MHLLSRWVAMLAIAAGAASLPARALELEGLWFDPAIPGRGLSLHEQGGTLFATFYTYDAAGRGIWYVASDVRSTGVDFDSCGTGHWTGTLFEARGPALGSATPPLVLRQVGTLDLASLFVSRCSDYGKLFARATIDGVATNLPLQRQTFKSMPIEGSYGGTIVRSAACDGAPLEVQGDLNIFRQPDGQLTLSFSTPGSPPSYICRLDGNTTPSGGGIAMTGTQNCRLGLQSVTRAFVIEDLTGNDHGVTASITYPGSTPTPACGNSRISGVRYFPR